MKFLTTPLAALSSSFVTWYALQSKDGALVHDAHRPAPEFENDEGWPDTQGGVAEEDTAEAAAAIARLKAELRAKDIRIKELEQTIAGGAEPGAAFHDLMDAGARTAGILQDIGSHAAGKVTSKLWPWPSPKVEMPDIATHIKLVRQKTSEHLEPAAGAVHELRKKVPREVSEPLLGALESAKGALLTAHSRTSSAAQATMDNFLEAHPQHQKSFSGVHPVYFFLIVVLIVVVTLTELCQYGRSLLALLRRICRLMCWVACCRCCCRKATKQQPQQQQPSPAAAAPAAVTPAPKKPSSGKQK